MSTFCLVVAAGVLIGCAVGVMWGAWGLRCNERTYRERLDLLEAAFLEPRLTDEYCSVQYEDHLWARQCFRDPFSLYDRRLIDRLDPPTERPFQ